MFKHESERSLHNCPTSDCFFCFILKSVNFITNVFAQLAHRALNCCTVLGVCTEFVVSWKLFKFLTDRFGVLAANTCVSILCNHQVTLELLPNTQ